MATNVMISCNEAEKSSPSMAFFDILIIIKSMGSITGNPRIAISVWLLLALAAMAEIIVSAKEKLIAANNKLAKNKAVSTIGLPKMML